MEMLLKQEQLTYFRALNEPYDDQDYTVVFSSL